MERYKLNVLPVVYLVVTLFTVTNALLPLATGITLS